MPSPTPAGGYIFPWAFQSCHICHKRTVRRVQEAHKARPSSEGALQAPARLAMALLPALPAGLHSHSKSSWGSAVRDRQLRPSPCQAYTSWCWWLLHPNLQPPAEPCWKPCLSPKGLNMIQEPLTEKFSHTVNTWEKSSVTTTKERNCMVPIVTLYHSHTWYITGIS